jgi:hypothetical protein
MGEYSEIPYYFYIGKNYFPILEMIKNNHAIFIEEKINKCISDSPLDYVEYNPEEMYISIILNTSYIVNIDIPIIIRVGKSITEISSFQHSMDYDFEKVFNLLGAINKVQEKYPLEYPIGVVTYEVNKNNCTFSVMNLKNSTVLTSVTCNLLPSRNVTFNYLSKYDWNNTI